MESNEKLYDIYKYKLIDSDMKLFTMIEEKTIE